MWLKDEPGRLLIRSSPRLYWVVGSLVALSGALCVLAALGLLAGAKADAFARILTGLFGTMAIAVGAWLCWHAPLFAVAVDRATHALTLTRRGLLWTATEHYPGGAISDVRVTKERDGIERPVYRLELVFDTGQVIPIALSARHDRQGCMRAAEYLCAALSKA